MELEKLGLVPQTVCPHRGSYNGKSQDPCLIMLDHSAPFGLQLFSCNFSPKIALVTCPSAFRLRWLAQTVRRDLGRWHISLEFLHQMALLTRLGTGTVMLLHPYRILWSSWWGPL